MSRCPEGKVSVIPALIILSSCSVSFWAHGKGVRSDTLDMRFMVPLEEGALVSRIRIGVWHAMVTMYSIQGPRGNAMTNAVQILHICVYM